MAEKAKSFLVLFLKLDCVEFLSISVLRHLSFTKKTKMLETGHKIQHNYKTQVKMFPSFFF